MRRSLARPAVHLARGDTSGVGLASKCDGPCNGGVDHASLAGGLASPFCLLSAGRAWRDPVGSRPAAAWSRGWDQNWGVVPMFRVSPLALALLPSTQPWHGLQAPHHGLCSRRRPRSWRPGPMAQPTAGALRGRAYPWVPSACTRAPTIWPRGGRDGRAPSRARGGASVGQVAGGGLCGGGQGARGSTLILNARVAIPWGGVA